MNPIDPAEEFLARKKAEDPERFRLLALLYPVQTAYRELRDRIGGPPRRGRRKSGGVPREMKRTFTDEEWAEAVAAKQAGLREWRLDYALALEQQEGAF